MDKLEALPPLTGSQRGQAVSNAPPRVSVVAFDMDFVSLVGFMLKAWFAWMLATATLAVVGGVLGLLAVAALTVFGVLVQAGT